MCVEGGFSDTSPGSWFKSIYRINGNTCDEARLGKQVEGTFIICSYNELFKNSSPNTMTTYAAYALAWRFIVQSCEIFFLTDQENVILQLANCSSLAFLFFLIAKLFCLAIILIMLTKKSGLTNLPAM